ncbi:MAG: hypothetical protein EOP00_29825, partial [Pedobacter sp.]
MNYLNKLTLPLFLILFSSQVMAEPVEKTFLNLDFEKTNTQNKPKGWYILGKGYNVKIDDKQSFNGKKSLLIESVQTEKDYAVSTIGLSPQGLIGKKMTLTGYIKTADVKDGYAGLWIRVDGKGQEKLLAFDNMNDRGVIGTTDWKKYTIEFMVKENASNISIGTILTGRGKAWFDNLEMMVDGQSFGSDQVVYKEPSKNEISWLNKNIIPLKTVKAGNGFDDLKPLNEIIGEAKIVSLGESTHGSKEIFQMKHRIIEYLANEKGFDIFAIEAAMPESYKLNDYVIHGKGDPRALISGMYFWTWDTEEVLEMVLWMRKYNESGKGKIQFTGYDMQSIDMALVNLKDFSMKHDKDLLALLEKMTKLEDKTNQYMKEIKQFGYPKESLPQYINLSNQIFKHISDNKSKYLKQLSAYEYEWLKQNSMIIVQYSLSLSKENKGYIYRDQSMANNIKWIVDNNPKSKVIVWAHNG